MRPLRTTTCAVALALMSSLGIPASTMAQDAASEDTPSRTYNKRIQIHEVDIGVKPQPDEEVDDGTTRFKYDNSPALDAIPISPMDYYQAPMRLPNDRKKGDRNWLTISTDEDEEPASGWGWLADEVRIKNDLQRVGDDEDADREREEEAYEAVDDYERIDASDADSYLLHDPTRDRPSDVKEIRSSFTFDEEETARERTTRNETRDDQRRARDGLQLGNRDDPNYDADTRSRYSDTSREKSAALYRTDNILNDIGSPLRDARNQAWDEGSRISTLSPPDTPRATAFSTEPSASIGRSSFGTFAPQADQGFGSSISSERSVFGSTASQTPKLSFDARPSVIGSLNATPSTADRGLGSSSSLGALGGSRSLPSDSLAIPSSRSSSDSIQTMREFQRPAGSIGWD